MKQWTVCGAALLLFGASLVGCQKTAEGVAEDTKKAAEATGTAAGKAMDATGKALETAGEKLADFSSDAAMATTVTPNVKSAIIADAMLNDPANTIDVDSKDRVVHLKGSVQNNDMKRKAGEIAAATLKSMNAPADIKVSNELIVKSR